MPGAILGPLNSVPNNSEDQRQKACSRGVHIQVTGNRQLAINIMLLLGCSKRITEKIEPGEKDY